MNQERGALAVGEFERAAKAAVYRAIGARRDIRAQFTGASIPEPVLARILWAAHRAPSVGFMQPCNFIVVRSRDVRQAVHAAFARANERAAAMFPDARRAQYRGFKLEGILESSLNLCITCDRSRFGPVVLGRTENRAMDLFSAVCAVENLWLAARTEGIGVGWVSIIAEQELRAILELPPDVVPIAYLCVGYVTHFPDRPELETAGWLPRVPLEDVVFTDHWNSPCRTGEPELHAAIRACAKAEPFAVER